MVCDDDDDEENKDGFYRRETKDVMEELDMMKKYDHDGNYEKQPAGRDVTAVENELVAG